MKLNVYFFILKAVVYFQFDEKIHDTIYLNRYYFLIFHPKKKIAVKATTIKTNFLVETI